MGVDFTSIDFETANGFRGSPCSVGLSKVRGGRIVEEATHEQLKTAGGIYQKIYETQTAHQEVIS